MKNTFLIVAILFVYQSFAQTTRTIEVKVKDTVELKVTSADVQITITQDYSDYYGESYEDEYEGYDEGDYYDYILVEDFMLAIGQFLEAGKGGVQRLIAIQLDSQFLQAGLEGITPGMLTEHKLVLCPAHVLRTHDFVGFTVLQHAILMNTGLMSEGVGANHRLVRLHRVAGDLGNQLGGRNDLRRIDARLNLENIRPRPHGHDNFFQRCIAGPLAQTVDRALDLTRTSQHGRQRIGNGEP